MIQFRMMQICHKSSGTTTHLVRLFPLRAPEVVARMDRRMSIIAELREESILVHKIKLFKAALQIFNHRIP